MNLKSRAEAILFASGKAISVKDLAEVLEIDKTEASNILQSMANDYHGSDGGLMVLENSGKYQMATNPEHAEIVSKFFKNEMSGELSRASLETLTIIAYRGPVSKLDLDRIRGINCSLIIRNLLIKGLIEEIDDKVKNNTYYHVTLDFIRFLGVSRVEELPDYERLHADDSLDRIL